VGASFSDRGFLPLRNLTDAAGGFLLGLLLGLGIEDKERIQSQTRFCAEMPRRLARQVMGVLKVPTRGRLSLSDSFLHDCRVSDRGPRISTGEIWRAA
jgi:hypothetical protein